MLKRRKERRELWREGKETDDLEEYQNQKEGMMEG